MRIQPQHWEREPAWARWAERWEISKPFAAAAAAAAAEAPHSAPRSPINWGFNRQLSMDTLHGQGGDQPLSFFFPFLWGKKKKRKSSWDSWARASRIDLIWKCMPASPIIKTPWHRPGSYGSGPPVLLPVTYGSLKCNVDEQVTIAGQQSLG